MRLTRVARASPSTSSATIRAAAGLHHGFQQRKQFVQAESFFSLIRIGIVHFQRASCALVTK